MLAEKIFIGGEFVNELNKLQREGIQAPLEFLIFYIIFFFPPPESLHFLDENPLAFSLAASRTLCSRMEASYRFGFDAGDRGGNWQDIIRTNFPKG
jgi:hypothetical protein